MLRKRGRACFGIVVGFSVVSACGDDAGDGTDSATSADETTASGDTTEPATGDETVDPSDNSDTAGVTSTDQDSTIDETTGNTSSTTDSSAEAGPTRGAVSMHVVPKGDCSLGDTWVDFPQVEGGHPVTATAHDTLSENLTFDDQGRRVKVNCEWLDSGDTTTFLLSISADSDTDGELFSAQAALADGLTAEAPISFTQSEELPRWRTLVEKRCLFSTTQLSRESIWGTFTCSVLTDGETEECEVVEGHFYFENCKPRQL